MSPSVHIDLLQHKIACNRSPVVRIMVSRRSLCGYLDSYSPSNDTQLHRRLKMNTDSNIKSRSLILVSNRGKVDTIDDQNLLTDEHLDRLSRSLFKAANLPDGDDFVCIIGNGHEKSNQEAVYSLLVNNRAQLSSTRNENNLERGLDILKCRFEDINSYFCS